MASKSYILGPVSACFKTIRRLAGLALIVISTLPCFAVSIQSPPDPASPASPQAGSYVADPPSISRIERERDGYQKLYYRYLFFYWFLAVGAGGPALAAAIKSFKPVNVGNQSFDGWLLSLSLVTVISTTLLASIQPNVVANRYRSGQILLDKALTRYDGIVGRKTQADVDAVQAAYDTAEDLLIGGTPRAPQPPDGQHH